MDDAKLSAIVDAIVRELQASGVVKPTAQTLASCCFIVIIYAFHSSRQSTHGNLNGESIH
jgi:hypothetical protein